MRWSRADLRLLMDLVVGEAAQPDWDAVAKALPFSAVQCKQKYFEMRGGSSAFWTAEEDAALEQAVLTFASKHQPDTWQRVADHVSKQSKKTALECEERSVYLELHRRRRSRRRKRQKVEEDASTAAAARTPTRSAYIEYMRQRRGQLRRDDDDNPVWQELTTEAKQQLAARSVERQVETNLVVQHAAARPAPKYLSMLL